MKRFIFIHEKISEQAGLFDSVLTIDNAIEIAEKNGLNFSIDDLFNINIYKGDDIDGFYFVYKSFRC